VGQDEETVSTKKEGAKSQVSDRKKIAALACEECEGETRSQMIGGGWKNILKKEEGAGCKTA